MFVRIAAAHHRLMPPDSVSVGLPKPPARSNPNLRVQLGNKVVADLGLSAGVHVEVLWGKDDDIGKILFARALGGGSKLKHVAKSHSGTLYVILGNLPPGPLSGLDGERWSLTAEKQPMTYAEFTQGDGGIVITLPRDWWAVVPSSEALRRAAIERRADPGLTSEIKRVAAVPMPRREGARC